MFGYAKKRNILLNFANIFNQKTIKQQIRIFIFHNHYYEEK
jgi:hypothetical protein